MKIKTHTVLTIFSLMFLGTVRAQQDIQFTQYMYNTVLVNPAYAGSWDGLSISGTYRSQWVGLDGAPRTLSFSAHGPVRNRLSLGISVLRDEIGPSIESSYVMDMSYTLYLNRVRLAFGLKAGLSNLDIDFGRLNTYDPTDVELSQNINQISPQIGVGAYLYSNKWYLGISSPNVLETDHYDQVAVSTAMERLHFYVITGYVFDLNDHIKIKPAALLKMVSGAPLSLDLSTNVMIEEKLILGASYRWNASVSALAGFQLTDDLMLGYAYDFDTTEISRYNSGSHEIFLRFIVRNRKSGKVSPRFF
ncbi:type IX secretion system membrane protein PorP/SprF [Flagellimonas aurea]|uniref:PorP/SprF family type IX secretion system membrane protein n=1 Tax=Flagellimonas aurea TaxID=2915619 RepID=UPI0035D000C1